MANRGISIAAEYETFVEVEGTFQMSRWVTSMSFWSVSLGTTLSNIEPTTLRDSARFCTARSRSFGNQHGSDRERGGGDYQGDCNSGNKRPMLPSPAGQSRSPGLAPCRHRLVGQPSLEVVGECPGRQIAVLRLGASAFRHTASSAREMLGLSDRGDRITPRRARSSTSSIAPPRRVARRSKVRRGSLPGHRRP